MRFCAHILAVLVLSAILWAVFVAKPMVIESTEVRPLEARPGEQVRIINYSMKADWAAAFCSLEKDVVYFIDADGVVREAVIEGRAKNYNDGSIYRHTLDLHLPFALPPGPTKVYKALTYRCFGLLSYTAYTKRGRWGTVIIK